MPDLSNHSRRFRLQVVDDDPVAIELVREALSDFPLDISSASDRDSALHLVAAERPHFVLLDLVLPGVRGMELLGRILEIHPGVDVALMTAHYSTESAVEAIQTGAYDYLTKPLSVAQFRKKMGRWLDDAVERERALELEHELLDASQFEGIVGRSPLMLDVFSKIHRIAPHFVTALITGATGTGKELAARALYRLSAVSGPFVVCNCAAMPESLFESELFGCVKGAFTGAFADRAGLIESAERGVLLLDEIGDVPPSIQAKLLRVIQNREVQRLGSPRVRHVDVRIVAATNRDLREMAGERKFREDLYYRLAMVEVRLPRLADRKEDIPLLQRHFLDRFSRQYGRPPLSLSRRTQAMLNGYDWPGNVRELENVLSYAAMVAQNETLEIRDLPESLRAQLERAELPDNAGGGFLTLKDVQQAHVRKVLALVKGNRSRAADVLGISRATLYRML